MGIINELRPTVTSLTYFFIQGTDSKLNKAVTVLQGLLYLLLVQQPVLIDALVANFHDTEYLRFDDINGLYTLFEIFDLIFLDPRLLPTTLIIDALDECETGLP